MLPVHGRYYYADFNRVGRRVECVYLFWWDSGRATTRTTYIQYILQWYLPPGTHKLAANPKKLMDWAQGEDPSIAHVHSAFSSLMRSRNTISSQAAV